MHTIQAEGYNVFVGKFVLDELQQFIEERYAGCSLFVVVDDNTRKHCLPVLLDGVPALSVAKVIEIQSGEEYKTLDTCQHVWTQLFEGQANRNSVVVNLGGGVIGDLGGFCAATFKRGIRFLNVPTTLLSQVDASVGGKLGVDFNHLKNQIGVFKNPEAVFVNTGLLSTLSPRQIVSGYAEVLKHALIRDAQIWSELETQDLSAPAELSEMVWKSVQVKNQVVLEDPQEKGLRKLLNFGHTIGHAVETWSLKNDAKPLLHGEAIAIGMIAESYIAMDQIGFSKADMEAMVGQINKHFPLSKVNPASFDELVALMKTDKKNEDAAINFTLLRAIGNGDVNFTAEPSAIIDALNRYNQLLDEL